MTAADTLCDREADLLQRLFAMQIEHDSFVLDGDGEGALEIAVVIVDLKSQLAALRQSP